MSRARQPPLVTGISPKEGAAWTKVTIRGENLGTGPADLIGLSICGHNCLLTAEWMSASKIVCRVGPAKDDKGEIIVTTKSGGLGTSTVSFKLLRPERIGILDQSAVWVDEMNYYDMRTDRNKGISPLSLRPSNPLGIEIDKYSKLPQKDIELTFPGMSGDFTSENFSATWYLIENHMGSSFEQLKIAANNLKKQATKKNEGSLAYVKGGLSTFFEAQDALAAIHQRLESDGTERVEGSMTQRLENILNRASDTADTLFQEVLGRKDKADSTRNALNVLQRFKFLFNLPLNIERNIQKGDYDVVINDYEKAKSLFGNTEVPVFKKVYVEVEMRIGALRSLLLEKLLQTPSTLHDQKRYIRYLSDLHAPGDPAWQCIYAQHKWILQLMQNCRDEFINALCLHSPLPLDQEGDTRPSALGRLSHTASLKRGGSLRTPRPSTWRFETPQQVQFVEKLSDVVIGQLPNFWKLWISYVNGSLFSEVNTGGASSKMIEEMINRLVKLVRGALLPTTLPQGELSFYGGWENKTELTGAWLTQVIHTVRFELLACHEALSALEIPNDLQQVIQDLLLELRVHCLMVSLLHTTEDVKRLAEKEDWVVDNEGITSLPSQFEQCMVQMLQSFKEPLEIKPGEINVRESQLQSSMPRSSHMTIINTTLASSEQRLLIILSNCQYLERRTFLNLANHFEKHSLTGTEKITRVSLDAVRELDRKLFEAYIERRADPISGSLEPGIYAGYFEWRDCQTPTGVRNYLKEALVSIITVHAEVFTVSKDLVPRVLSQIVESVADEMCRLMQCVSSFSKNGALQARLELCALRDVVATYLNSESSASFNLALDALPQLHNGADKKLLEELLNTFKSSMQLQLTCFQPCCIQPVKR
uniref:Exocyst complex component 2 n=1 Tax=Cyclopterus lumpus TaxID=8103 RepID=A0A8C3A7G2_CYCLU